MCETAGYVPTSAAGKEIRCANPKCLVPVFTAPGIQRKKADEPAPEKKGLPIILLVTLGLLLVLGGGAAWYVFNRPGPANTPRPAPPAGQVPPVLANTGANAGATDPKTALPTQENPVNPPAGEKPLTLAEDASPSWR